jgi:PAS domain S-box-containing protein
VNGKLARAFWIFLVTAAVFLGEFWLSHLLFPVDGAKQQSLLIVLVLLWLATASTFFWLSQLWLKDISGKFHLYQKQVAASEERLQLAIDASSGGVWDWNLETNDVQFDTKYKSMLGYTDDEIKNHLDEFKRLTHPDDVVDALQAAVDFIEGKSQHFSTRFRMKAKDGDYRWIHSEGLVKRSEDGRPLRLIGWHRDVTQDEINRQTLLQHQTQMIQSAKLSSLGEMAGGLAHEINNPLMIIEGYTEQALTALESKDYDPLLLKNKLSIIRKTTQRIEKIVKSLRKLSRDGTNDPQTIVDVLQMVTSVTQLCEDRFKAHGVELSISAPHSSIFVKCRETELEQTLINLLNNAFDAVERLSDRWVKVEMHALNELCQINVINNGAPIPTELHEKIFEPFFTTKEVSKGTGLGLSLSRQFIESNGGKIYYDPSSPTPAFKITLPIHQTNKAHEVQSHLG